MPLKKIYSIIIVAIIFVAGISTGNYIHNYYTHCMTIRYRKDLFYGRFAVELKKAMENKGYHFMCPAIFPKTVIDFTYTNNQALQSKYEKKAKDTNIALVGDCYTAFDIDFLKTYDYLLTVNEVSFGYLAMFNFKALHFPIKDTPNKSICNTRYEEQTIDIDDVAEQLDNIVRRTR